jgi:3-oxoacyl-[acyl-carrier protein] reductase
MKPIAIVTGASRGIGRAIAISLSNSHQIIGTFRGATDAAASLTDQIGAIMLACDLSLPQDRTRLLQQLAEHPAPDLVVNNAGMAPRERRDILDATEDSFDEIISTNLKGPYFLTQALAKRMVKHGSGRIVFVTSISANTASINRGDYCISKAGLSMAAQLFAARLAADGIGVFEVRPGIIRTDMIAKVRDAYEERAKSILPQQRLGDPEDVAKVIQAIAAGYLDYCAGQVLQVDGGFQVRTL